jgi:glycosyltransferase involved in cell wall biosynthesis
VVFAGFVEDLPGMLRGGIMLAPLRIGSGLRVKIIAAMAQGVPVVSTSVGSEGLLVEDGKELMVRDDKSEFAAAAVELARNPELWRRVATAGQAAAVKYYSPEGVRQRRNEIYGTLTSASGGR